MSLSFLHSRGSEAPIKIPAIGLDLFVRMPPTASGGEFCFIETVNAPGGGPTLTPPSRGGDFRVIEGRYLYEVDGRRFFAEAGDVVSIPGGALRNDGDGGRKRGRRIRRERMLPGLDRGDVVGCQESLLKRACRPAALVDVEPAFDALAGQPVDDGDRVRLQEPRLDPSNPALVDARSQSMSVLEEVTTPKEGGPPQPLMAYIAAGLDGCIEYMAILLNGRQSQCFPLRAAAVIPHCPDQVASPARAEKIVRL